MIAIDEYERLKKLKKIKAPSFAEMLLAIPKGDAKFDRVDAKARDVEF